MVRAHCTLDRRIAKGKGQIPHHKAKYALEPSGIRKFNQSVPKLRATCTLRRPATVNGDITTLYNTLDLGKDQEIEIPHLGRSRCGL